MGFFFRKSKSFGPFRITLSKQGLSYSVGVKGFRVTKSPRGTYITSSAGGFYVSERIDNKNKTQPQGKNTGYYSGTEVEEINSADIEDLVDSSSEQMISEINRRIDKVPLMPIFLILSVVFFFIPIQIRLIDYFLPAYVR